MPKLKAKAKRKPHAQDATLATLRKTRRDISEHARQLADLIGKVADLEDRVHSLEPPVIPVEPPAPETLPGDGWT